MIYICNAEIAPIGIPSRIIVQRVQHAGPETCTSIFSIVGLPWTVSTEDYLRAMNLTTHLGFSGDVINALVQISLAERLEEY
jgi:hypothetical protein